MNKILLRLLLAIVLLIVILVANLALFNLTAGKVTVGVPIENRDPDQLALIVIYIKSEVVNPLINILNNSMARGSVGAELDKRLMVKPRSGSDTLRKPCGFT